MKELRTYLDKYKSLTPPEASISKIFLDVVYRECGLQLTTHHIRLVRGGVHLECHPTMRSELLTCAPRVLRILHKKHNVHLAFIH